MKKIFKNVGDAMWQREEHMKRSMGCNTAYKQFDTEEGLGTRFKRQIKTEPPPRRCLDKYIFLKNCEF
jgi:hypothetical protein